MSDQFSPPNELNTSPYLKPISKTLVVDQVIDRLIALVVNENLHPGDKLPTERELMTRLNIGRSSLREAIKNLAAVGAVEVKRGSGIFVGNGDTSILARPLAWGMFLSRGNVSQVIEARNVIETALAGWAAERRSEDDLASIGEILDRLEKNQNVKDAYIEYDLKFHLAVANAAQNKILLQFLNIFQHLLQTWMEITYQETQGARESMHSHHQLFAAIQAQDANTARRIMQEHTSGAPLRSAVARQYSASVIASDFFPLHQEDKP